MEKQDEYRGTWAIRNEKGLTITEKGKYILYDLTRFNKTLDDIQTDEDRWLYLLKNAGSSNEFPDFDDDVIAQAIKRILVKTASEKTSQGTGKEYGVDRRRTRLSSLAEGPHP